MLTWEPETHKPIPVTLTIILFGNVIQLNKLNTKELPGLCFVLIYFMAIEFTSYMLICLF